MKWNIISGLNKSQIISFLKITFSWFYYLLSHTNTVKYKNVFKVAWRQRKEFIRQIQIYCFILREYFWFLQRENPKVVKSQKNRTDDKIKMFLFLFDVFFSPGGKMWFYTILIKFKKQTIGHINSYAYDQWLISIFFVN